MNYLTHLRYDHSTGLQMDALVRDPHQDDPMEASRTDRVDHRGGVEKSQNNLFHLLPVLLDTAQVVCLLLRRHCRPLVVVLQVVVP